LTTHRNFQRKFWIGACGTRDQTPSRCERLGNMDRSSKACHAPAYTVRTTAHSRGPPNCSLFKECWRPRPQVGVTPVPRSDSRKGRGECSGRPPSVKAGTILPCPFSFPHPNTTDDDSPPKTRSLPETRGPQRLTRPSPAPSPPTPHPTPPPSRLPSHADAPPAPPGKPRAAWRRSS
jgi:hypothetical protein